MTEATVTLRINSNDPTEEIVLLEADDTETYESKKFSQVVCGHATVQQDFAAVSIPVSLVCSGTTVAMNCTGLSSHKVLLTLYGRD